MSQYIDCVFTHNHESNLKPVPKSCYPRSEGNSFLVILFYCWATCKIFYKEMVLLSA